MVDIMSYLRIMNKIHVTSLSLDRWIPTFNDITLIIHVIIITFSVFNLKITRIINFNKLDTIRCVLSYLHFVYFIL